LLIVCCGSGDIVDSRASAFSQNVSLDYNHKLR
jgi:hypothetical protein